jgi:hypothetical protein
MFPFFCNAQEIIVVKSTSSVELQKASEKLLASKYLSVMSVGVATGTSLLYLNAVKNNTDPGPLLVLGFGGAAVLQLISFSNYIQGVKAIGRAGKMLEATSFYYDKDMKYVSLKVNF